MQFTNLAVDDLTHDKTCVKGYLNTTLINPSVADFGFAEKPMLFLWIEVAEKTQGPTCVL